MSKEEYFLRIFLSNINKLVFQIIIYTIKKKLLFGYNFIMKCSFPF